MPEPHQAITRVLVTEFGEQIRAMQPVAIEPGSDFDRECREILERIESAYTKIKADGN
jgi:hypothetical protein